MRIYIVRHGETKANKSGRIQGWSDTELTDLGIKLAEKTGEGLKDVKFDIAFSSPLKRALDTCKIILSKNKYDTEIVLENRLKEINMGLWEGKCIKERNNGISENDLKLFFENPFLLKSFPNGEHANDVAKRTQEFIKELSTKNYENVLVTTHGFALRALLNFMYENKEDFWQGQVPYNCAVNIIEVKDGEFKFIAKDKIYYDKKDCINRYDLNER